MMIRRYGSGVSLLVFGLLLASAQVGAEACAECHAETLGMHSHPVGMVYNAPGLQSDPGVPLPNGRVACISCHQNDGHRPPPHAALLVDSAKLCQRCHVI